MGVGTGVVLGTWAPGSGAGPGFGLFFKFRSMVFGFGEFGPPRLMSSNFFPRSPMFLRLFVTFFIVFAKIGARNPRRRRTRR